MESPYAYIPPVSSHFLIHLLERRGTWEAVNTSLKHSLGDVRISHAVKKILTLPRKLSPDLLPTYLKLVLSSYFYKYHVSKSFKNWEGTKSFVDIKRGIWKISLPFISFTWNWTASQEWHLLTSLSRTRDITYWLCKKSFTREVPKGPKFNPWHHFKWKLGTALKKK